MPYPTPTADALRGRALGVPTTVRALLASSWAGLHFQACSGRSVHTQANIRGSLSARQTQVGVSFMSASDLSDGEKKDNRYRRLPGGERFP